MPAILLIGNFLSASVGVRGVCEELAGRLSAAGWPVLTTSAKPGRMNRLGDMLATVWNRRHDYHVAHVDVYSGPAFFWAEAVAFALRRARKPHILTLHGGWLPEFSRAWPVRVGRLLRSAAAVTAPSGFLAGEMRGYRSDLRVIPNAIEIAQYPFRPRSNPRARLVWVRAFHENYDPTLAVRALALLRERAPDATLDMVGPDKGDGSFERVRSAAAELRVGSAVRLHGAVAKHEIASWIDRGDIFLNTTTVDNTPVTVVEAMACGACIVSTNVGGIPYLVKDESEALLVPPRNPVRMAAAIERFLNDPAAAARLSRSARAKAESFDWSVVLPQWQALLTAVARREAQASEASAISASSTPEIRQEKQIPSP